MGAETSSLSKLCSSNRRTSHERGCLSHWKVIFNLIILLLFSLIMMIFLAKIIIIQYHLLAQIYDHIDDGNDHITAVNYQLTHHCGDHLSVAILITLNHRSKSLLTRKCSDISGEFTTLSATQLTPRSFSL